MLRYDIKQHITSNNLGQVNVLNILLYCFWYREWNEKFLQCDHHAQLDAVFSETLFFRWKFFSTTDLEAKIKFLLFHFSFRYDEIAFTFFARTAAWCLFNRLINLTFFCWLEYMHVAWVLNWNEALCAGVKLAEENKNGKEKTIFWSENQKWMVNGCRFDADLFKWKIDLECIFDLLGFYWFLLLHTFIYFEEKFGLIVIFWQLWLIELAKFAWFWTFRL